MTAEASAKAVARGRTRFQSQHDGTAATEVEPYDASLQRAPRNETSAARAPALLDRSSRPV